MLPLYKGLLKLNESHSHPGLLFDKFPDGWAWNWHDKLPDNNVKMNFFNKFVTANHNYLTNGLTKMLQRQEALVEHLGGTNLYVKTDWRFLSGLGSSHPYETGFIWHRTLGVPYIPGSAVKGMMRAWAEQWCQEKTMLISRLFGFPSEKDTTGGGAGSLIVFDALPVQPPMLELDILNPHYGPYYEKPENNPPADYYNPVPVFFLTVAPNQSFHFCLAPRKDAKSKAMESDLKKGKQLLNEALLTLGAGGKTAVGYGLFAPDPDGKKKAAERCLRIVEKGMPQEDRWRSELARVEARQLILRFSKNWTKTKNDFEGDFKRYMEIVRDVHGDTIRQWKDSRNKNEIKVFKKFFPNNQGD